MKYTFFWNGPFSNWYPVKFKYKGQNFVNSEQAFMWEKAKTFVNVDPYNEELANEILNSDSPAEVKGIGRMIQGFSNEVWDKCKFQIMYDVNIEKYKQNPRLLKKLLENSNFVEASPYDKIWGVGLAEDNPLILDEKNWRGENLLGKVLNKVKEDLQNS